MILYVYTVRYIDQLSWLTPNILRVLSWVKSGFILIKG